MTGATAGPAQGKAPEGMRFIIVRWLLVALALLFLAGRTGPAMALEPVGVSGEDVAIDLEPATDFYFGQGRNFQVTTVPAADGIVRRIEVEAKALEASGNWAVFALANNTDEQLDRLVVASHFRLVGSGILSPDLGSQRIASITPSQGFALERQSSTDADVFLVTLDPGSVVTFVAELTSSKLPELRLWEPNGYKDTINAFTLYRGIVLGIAGLLAVFLTILFVVKGSAMFPAAAALAWAVLAYICIDFDFWQKLLPLGPGQERIWRAGTEVALAFTLAMFLFAYLNLNRWHRALSITLLVWLCLLAGLGGLAAFEPVVASGIARLSLAATAGIGLALIIGLTFQGFDRAVMLIPTWCLIILWLAASWMTVTGRIDNDIIQPALGGGQQGRAQVGSRIGHAVGLAAGRRHPVLAGQERQRRGLLRQLDGAGHDEAGLLVEPRDGLVADVGLDDHPAYVRVGEAVLEHRGEGGAGEPWARRPLGGRDEHVHAEVARSHLREPGERRVRRVVGLREERRLAVDPPQPRVVGARRADAGVLQRHLVGGRPAHLPVAGSGVGDPAVQHAHGRPVQGERLDRGPHAETSSGWIDGRGVGCVRRCSGTPKVWVATRCSTG